MAAASAVTMDTDNQILVEAGIDPSLLELQGDQAPLELLAEFIKCLRSEEFIAAKLLCKKVLSLEPGNEIAKEFLPSLEERIQLDINLPSESSSSDEDTCSSEEKDDISSTSNSSDNESDSSFQEKKIATKHEHHCCHGNQRTP